MSLREMTKDLHHTCERHPVGQLMSCGECSEQQYADWLYIQRRIHDTIDPWLPPELRRAEALQEDLDQLTVAPRDNRMIEAYAQTLTDKDACMAAAYVIVGAHLMGGTLIAKQIDGRLPHGHVPEDEERKAMLRAWEPLRDRVELGSEATRCFGALLSAMEEVRQKGTVT